MTRILPTRLLSTLQRVGLPCLVSTLQRVGVLLCALCVLCGSLHSQPLTFTDPLLRLSSSPAAAAPSFNPTNLAFCTAWWDSGVGIKTNSSGSVTQWVSRWGTWTLTNQDSGGTAPTYLYNRLDGSNVVSFNKTNSQRLRCDNYTNANPATVFYVGKIGEAFVIGNTIYDSTNTSVAQRGGVVGAANYRRGIASTTARNSGTGYTSNLFVIYCDVFGTGTTGGSYTNNVQDITSGTTGAKACSGLILGSGVNLANPAFANVDLAAWLSYGTNLSLVDITNVYTFLRNSYP